MRIRWFIASWASAAFLSAVACGGNSGYTTSTGTANETDQQKAAQGQPAAGTTGTAAEAKNEPVSLTGCLQKGDGSNYILTELSEPRAGSAKASGDNRVEREQLNAAEHSYRLSAGKNVDDDEWDKLVGAKVKVDGTLAKRAEIGTSGSDTGREKIHEGDLAQVDVNSIQKVANACGGRNPRKK